VPELPSVPDTRRDEDLVEDLHGRRVADPYRWLEDLDSDETRAWVAAQNAVTEAHLDAVEVRGHVREVVASLWDHPRRGVPFRRDRRWFQLRNTGLQDQDVLWTALADDTSSVAPTDGWEVLLDPNPLSEDGTVSLNGLAVSDDGQRLAYGLSEAGSDWRTWHVRDTTTGEDTGDVVEWAKFTEATWLPDGSGFLYGAFDAPEEGEEFEAANRDQRLMLHRVGTAQADDLVVYHRPDEPEWSYHPDVSHDGRWLAIVVSHGTETDNRVHLARIAEDGGIGEIAPLFDREDAMYHPLGAVDDELWFHTDHDAPNGRVVAVDPTAGPEPALREVVAETDDRLEDVRLVGGAEPDDDGWLVCCYVHHASSRVTAHDLAGATRARGRAAGPRHGRQRPRADRLSGGRRDDAVHIGFEDFTSPVRVLRHDLASGRTVETDPSGLAAEGFVTEQVFVPSGEVRVPVFVVRREGTVADGARPTVLWGYGGFDIPILPHFRTAFRSWVELGGVLAVACLRGGGEYGKAWHDDGRLDNKQHVFDDAIAVAEWLTGQRGAETVDG
jgi:prolyl oligopeptidase